MKDSTLMGAVVLALGMVLAALVFGAFFYNARDTGDTVQTVGAATERFTTDIAKWHLTLSRRTDLSGRQDGFASISADVRSLQTQLRGLGVADTSIIAQPPTSHESYANGNVTGYVIQQSMSVISDDVDTIEGLALDPGSLQTGGASLQHSRVEYFYSGLDAMKRNLLASATEDARARAREILGADVNHMTTARAGVFQITEPYSTEVASYGMHTTHTRTQEITVTVHATFAVD